MSDNSRDKYDLDNFDSSGKPASKPTRNKQPEKPSNLAPDYGDDFNYQTGEDDDKGYVFDNQNNVHSHSSRNHNRKYDKKKISNTTVAVLVTIAVICVIGAVIFALTQCTDGDSPLKQTTAPSTSATEFSFEVTTQAVTEVVTTQPQTEVTTEAPTEATTAAATDAPTEEVTTLAPTESVTTAPAEDVTTATEREDTFDDSNGDDNGEDY